MLDYKLLEAFATIIKAGGFDKAARQLHITQSAVSQRLKLLEENVGQVLLSRTSPPLATKTGEMILKHFIKVRHLEDEVEKSVKGDGNKVFSRLPIGINADSLATWFLPVVSEFLNHQKILMDFYIDDQDVTHELLKKGMVMGCVSSQDIDIQGCGCQYIGNMRYRPLATMKYIEKYFPNGFTPDSAKLAPVVVFNRKDDLQFALLQTSNLISTGLNIHYVPSSESFVEMIVQGIGYGMIPDLQSREYLESGQLLPLVPDFVIDVPLYWHCWNLQSEILIQLTDCIINKGRDHIC